MAEIIRRIEDKDFQEVSDLFKGQKYNSANDLKWLFVDPENLNNYNSFIAIRNDVIIGVIAYVKSVYTQNGKDIVGICPMSWMLKSDYKGMAGVSLFREVSKLGDISIAVSGEEISQKLYTLFKYKKVAHYDDYFKILKPFDYYRILKKRSFFKKLGMFTVLMPSYFKSTPKKNKSTDIELVEYEYDNFVNEKENKNVFKKIIKKNYIDWLLKCPFLKSKAFVIKKGEEYLGICVLYMEKVGNTYKGRIVHLPFLGNNQSIWLSVIEKCTIFLKKEGCCFVSAVALHRVCGHNLNKSGFINLKKYRDNIYIKDDNKKMNEYEIEDWNMQFSEGDIMLRNF